MLVSGCQTAPEALSLPAAALTVAYAPWPAEDDAMPRAQTRSVELYAVGDAPNGIPVSLAAAAIVRERGAPFRGKSQLPIGSRWLSKTDVELWLAQRDSRKPWQQQQLGVTSAVIAASLLTTVREQEATEAKPRSPLPAVSFHWNQTGLRVQLETGSFGDPEHEVLVVDASLAEQEAAGLYVPAPRAGAGGLLLLLLPAGPPPATSLAQARTMAAAQAPEAKKNDAPPRSWLVAKQAIGERNRRPALLAVVTPLDIPRVTDLLLAADEAALIAITDRIEALDPRADNLPWHVEAATWLALVPRAERDELCPALLAAFTRQLGGLATDGATLRLLANSVTDGGDFSARLIDENIDALTDRSPAVRSRALTWLETQQIHVDDYDPNGSKIARRSAVRHYLKTREAGR